MKKYIVEGAVALCKSKSSGNFLTHTPRMSMISLILLE